jgi:hypothetical protein
LAYLDPFGNNNADSAFLTYRQYQQQAESEAEAVARDEYQAGQGYRPGRECMVWVTENGKEVCKTWRVITPGSTNKAISDASYTAVFDRLSNMDEEGEDSIIDLLTNLFWSFKNPGASSQEAGTSRPVGSDNCPGPEPCSNAGWQPQQLSSRTATNLSNNDLSELFDLFSGLAENFSNNTNNDQPEFNLTSNLDAEPVIITQFEASPDLSTIRWEATGAVNCYAGNDWVGTVPTILKDAPIEPAGQATTTASSLTSPTTYKIYCYGYDVYSPKTERELVIPPQ